MLDEKEQSIKLALPITEIASKTSLNKNFSFLRYLSGLVEYMADTYLFVLMAV